MTYYGVKVPEILLLKEVTSLNKNSYSTILIYSIILSILPSYSISIISHFVLGYMTHCETSIAKRNSVTYSIYQIFIEVYINYIVCFFFIIDFTLLGKQILDVQT